MNNSEIHEFTKILLFSHQLLKGSALLFGQVHTHSGRCMYLELFCSTEDFSNYSNPVMGKHVVSPTNIHPGAACTSLFLLSGLHRSGGVHVFLF